MYTSISTLDIARNYAKVRANCLERKKVPSCNVGAAMQVDIIVSQDQEGRARLSSSLAKLIVVFCFGGVMTFVRASLYSIAGARACIRQRNSTSLSLHIGVTAHPSEPGRC